MISEKKVLPQNKRLKGKNKGTVMKPVRLPEVLHPCAGLSVGPKPVGRSAISAIKEK